MSGKQDKRIRRKVEAETMAAAKDIVMVTVMRVLQILAKPSFKIRVKLAYWLIRQDTIKLSKHIGESLNAKR